MQGNEKSAGKSQKKSWFQGLQSEFKKIVWPDRKTLTKQTIAVVVVSTILAILISVMDAAILEGVNLLVKQDKGDCMSEAKWYVVHTYSGYENKVKANIEKTIENRHLEDQILEVRVPLEEAIEMRNGVAKQIQRKLFPGYVLLNMVMNDDTWYVVRNTRGVTGFVGPGSKPVPLTEEEMKTWGCKNEIEVDFKEGDMIVVTGGAWAGTESNIVSMNLQKKVVTINVELFGRETPVEISFAEIKLAD